MENPALLVVDDERVQRAWVKSLLSQQGWRVEEADDGAAAVAAIFAERFALVLMDIKMPIMDGYEAVAAVRAHAGAAASVPILAFTALRMGDADAHFRAAGMDGYLSKPCSPRTLIGAAEAWRPGDVPRPRERLGGLMSRTDLDGLLTRLREEIRAALASIDVSEGRASTAHRLAGLAGTLGFREVHRHWIALSEGSLDAIEPARIAARMAISTIDRDIEGADRP